MFPLREVHRLRLVPCSRACLLLRFIFCSLGVLLAPDETIPRIQNCNMRFLHKNKYVQHGILREHSLRAKDRERAVKGEISGQEEKKQATTSQTEGPPQVEEQMERVKEKKTESRATEHWGWESHRTVGNTRRLTVAPIESTLS